MPGAAARPIIDRVEELRRQYPDLPALQLLDAAMDGRQGQHIDFEVDDPALAFSDWLDPPSPFADLLRRAFEVPVEHFDAESPEWAAVIERFGEHYGLWGDTPVYKGPLTDLSLKSQPAIQPPHAVPAVWPWPAR